MMETPDGSLKEGSHGWLLEMGGELRPNPEAATKKERVSWAVQVGQHHVAHEAAKVELDQAFLDLGFYRLLGTSKGKHGCFVHLKSNWYSSFFAKKADHCTKKQGTGEY